MTFSESSNGKPQEVGQSKHDPRNRFCPWNNDESWTVTSCTCPEREEEKPCAAHCDNGCVLSHVHCRKKGHRPLSEPKEETPTSVTGDEWEGISITEIMQSRTILQDAFYRLTPQQLEHLEEEINIRMASELQTQRTHIKQALLGRVEKRFGDISYNNRRQEEACDEVVQELQGDITRIVNEELA